MTNNRAVTVLRKQIHKGAPARESRTGTRLVSPATGCKKKKDTSGAGPQNTKLSTLEIILASTDAMETGTASGKPLRPESGLKKKKKHTLPVKVLPYLDFFFSCIISQCLSKTLSRSIAIFD